MQLWGTILHTNCGRKVEIPILLHIANYYTHNAWLQHYKQHTNLSYNNKILLFWSILARLPITVSSESLSEISPSTERTARSVNLYFHTIYVSNLFNAENDHSQWAVLMAIVIACIPEHWPLITLALSYPWKAMHGRSSRNCSRTLKMHSVNFSTVGPCSCLKCQKMFMYHCCMIHISQHIEISSRLLQSFVSSAHQQYIYLRVLPIVDSTGDILVSHISPLIP